VHVRHDRAALHGLTGGQQNLAGANASIVDGYPDIATNDV
jgi:hypothetical protein